MSSRWSLRRWLRRVRPAGGPRVVAGVGVAGDERPALRELALRALATEHFDRFVAGVPISRARAGR